MRTTIIALITLILVGSAFAQPPTAVWTRTLGDAEGVRDPGIYSMSAGADGGVYVTGRCCLNVFHQAFASAWVARLDVNGNVSWSRDFWGTGGSSPGWDAGGYAIQTAADGGCIVGCGIGDLGSIPLPAALVRLNGSGDTLWARLIQPLDTMPNSAAVTAVCAAPGNGIAATARSDTRIVRADSAGNILWDHSIPDATLNSIIATPDGGFVAAGMYSPGFSVSFFLMKVNAAGDTLWTRHHYFLLGGSATAVLQTPQHGFIMAGKAFIPDTTQPAFGAVAATDSMGQLLWWRTYDDPEFISMKPCAEGGYILLSDRLVRINEDGDTLWTKALSSDTYSYKDVVQTADSGYVVGGYSGTEWGGSAELTKFSREGLATDPSFILHPYAFILSAYPNPFNPGTTLSFALSKAGRTSIVVYDITGREVQTLINETLTAGEHTLPFDGSALPSGIYFARVNSGESIATQKLLLLK
ncbi:MAG TPA: T9SS type A sorting domain-containing protein [bacterium]|jgi:hypothetical protein